VRARRLALGDDDFGDNPLPLVQRAHHHPGTLDQVDSCQTPGVGIARRQDAPASVTRPTGVRHLRSLLLGDTGNPIGTGPNSMTR
jgi:hypothetical protein